MAKTKGLLISGFVIALIGLVGVLEVQRQSISAKLTDLTQQMDEGSLEDTNAQRNQEIAAQIIEEVRALIEIDTEVEPTVATIVDVELLREQNPFYNNAENGDHLIVTPNRAILYSSEKKKIIDVAPVQLAPSEGESEE